MSGLSKMWFGIVAAAIAGCGKSEPPKHLGQAPADEAKNAEAKDAKSAPAAVKTRLPAERPSPFSASHRVGAGKVTTTTVLATDASTLSMAHGGRRVSVRFSSTPADLDAIYKVIRDNKCDLIKTELVRGGDSGGSSLQLRAGKLRTVANDRDNTFPKKEWRAAYDVCTAAIDKAAPKHGDAPHADIIVEFHASLDDTKVRVKTDAGPDLLGITWPEKDNSQATVHLGKLRPLTLAIAGSGTKTNLELDPTKTSGIRVRREGSDDKAKLVVEPLDGPAKTTGEVAAGPPAVTTQTKDELAKKAGHEGKPHDHAPKKSPG